jgi:hypothetical protein
MPDPIKTQILDRVATVLTPLVTNATFRSLTRETDRLREAAGLVVPARPALRVVATALRNCCSSGWPALLAR